MVEFFASIATVIGFPLLIIAVWLAQAGLAEQRREQAEGRTSRRATILFAVRIEITTIHMAVDRNLQRFAGAAQDLRMYFVWPPLPVSTVEQSIQDAYLLRLTPEHLEALQSLRLHIVHVNAFTDAKNHTLPSVETGAVAQAVTRMNEEIQARFSEIRDECTRMLEWLSAAGTGQR